MWSFWEQETFIREPDLLVIGSGIVGLSAAIHFKKKNSTRDVLVIEAAHLPSGASTKNAGFACFGSPSELHMDLNNSSPQEVFGLVKRRWDGLELLRNWIGDDQLKYESPGSYELFFEKKTYQKCLDRLDFFNKECKSRIGFSPYEENKEIISNSGFRGFAGAIQIKGEGQIHTGSMMKHLIALAEEAGIRIINGLKVEDIHQSESYVDVHTQSGKIRASNCLVATNGFAKKLLPELESIPARAQVLVTQPIENLKFRGTYHFDQGYYYFRNIDDRVLFGGGRNQDMETETTDEIALNQEIQEHLAELLSKHVLPASSFEIEQQWSGIMGVGSNKEPIVKKLDDNLFCAVKLGGMGVAIGSLVGKEIAEMIYEGKSPSTK